MIALRTAPVLALLLAAGCGYQPPAQVDRGKPSYQADLDSCHDASVTSVNKQNAKTGLAWVSAPVRRWGQIGRATQACMEAKGYGRVRWCTQEELRGAARSGNATVTAAGLQCTEPPSPARR